MHHGTCQHRMAKRASLLRRRRTTGASAERNDGFGTDLNWLGYVRPVHAPFRGDDFPDIVRNRIEIPLGELHAAPRASGVPGLGPQRGRKLAPDADLFELADGKPDAKRWNVQRQIKV